MPPLTTTSRPGLARRKWTLFAAAAATMALIALAFVVPFGPLLKKWIEFFRAAGPVPFFCAMAVLPIVGAPLSPFIAVAGPVFGPILGVGTVIGCTIAAVAVNVALSYGLAVCAVRPLVERAARWLGYEMPTLPSGTAWEIALLTRILPGPPFFIQSYLLGIARVPFRIYMVVSVLVPAVYLSAAILAGDALMRRDWRGLVLPAVLFAVAAFALRRLRKRLQTPQPSI